MAPDNQNNTQPLSRYEEKRARREERERQERLASRRRRLRRWGIAAAVILLLVLAGVGLVRFAKKNERELPGRYFPSMGRQHVAQTPKLEEYNSLPPTSGPHFSSQTNWGIHREPLPEGYQVHNLEHGGVVMQYKPGASTELVAKLTAIGESYKWKKIILAPYPPLDAAIALTAWEHLDKFDEFDETRIRRFIDAFRNRGPENVPDDMPSVPLP